MNNAGKFLKNLSFSLAIMLLLFAGCLFILFFVADLVLIRKSMAFDDHVFEIIKPIVTKGFTSFMLIVTFFGSQKFLVPANILLILFFLLIKKNRHNAFRILGISLTNVAVLFLLKDILQRERPMVPLIAKVHGFSFPSGHTFSSATFFGMLAYIAWFNICNLSLRITTVLLLCFFPLLIGFSRIYLRLHFASDVIAGLCLGLMWLLLAWWFLIRKKDMGMKVCLPSRNKADAA